MRNAGKIQKVVILTAACETNFSLSSFARSVDYTAYDRETNRFFYVRGISYADISDTNVVIFPVLIKNNDSKRETSDPKEVAKDIKNFYSELFCKQENMTQEQCLRF